MNIPSSDSAQDDSDDFEGPYVYINSRLVRQKMEEKGLSSQKLANAMSRILIAAKMPGISKTSIQRVVNDRRIHRSKFQSLADALGVLPASLLASSSYREKPQPKFDISPPNDWKIVEFVSQPTTAANGVSYRVAKLQSKIIEKNFARGKFYEFFEVPPAEEVELLERMKRHATVCESLRDSTTRNIARHRTIVRFDEDTAWWILDEWIEGKTLKSLISEGVRFKSHQIKTIGTEILVGLNELHRSKIFFRELAPERVYFSEDLLKCTLTDFELAKVLQKVPTVSGPWRTSNAYRALENVEEKTITPTNFARTDIYSWAAIVIELFTGDPLANLEALTAKLDDKSIVTFLLKCRSRNFNDRPKSIEEVQKGWAAWTPTK